MIFIFSYSVFGLGSRAYPKFCEFAKLVNRMFHELGAEKIFPLGEGDELCGQEQAFQAWAEGVFKVQTNGYFKSSWIFFIFEIVPTCLLLFYLRFYEPSVNRSFFLSPSL